MASASGAVATRHQLSMSWGLECHTAGNREVCQLLALPRPHSGFKLHLKSSSPEFLHFFACSLSPNLWCSLSCSQGNPESAKFPTQEAGPPWPVCRPHPWQRMCSRHMTHVSTGHFHKVEPRCPQHSWRPEFT